MSVSTESASDARKRKAVATTKPPAKKKAPAKKTPATKVDSKKKAPPPAPPATKKKAKLNGQATPKAAAPPPSADGMELRQIPIASFKPYDRNPRTHSAAQVEQIAAIIKSLGFRNPLLVDEKLEVIAGHGRLAAATILGMPKVPAIILRGLSDDQKRALRIADNRIALNAGWDEELLAAELSLLGEFDQSLLGFSDEDLQRLVQIEPEATSPGSFSRVDESLETTHKCPKCGYEWSGQEAAK